MEINLTELREQRRPLWMTNFGVGSFAEFLGDGGDIHTDRLWPEWERFGGEELIGQELEEAKKLEPEYTEGSEVSSSGIGGQGSIVGDAFMYVHESE